jgi:hypothetical protein
MFIRLFFLLPITMCAIWWWYLNRRGYSLKEGFRGFMYIFAFNAFVLLFFVMMMWLTHT